jgi:hypothetical protein
MRSARFIRRSYLRSLPLPSFRRKCGRAQPKGVGPLIVESRASDPRARPGFPVQRRLVVRGLGLLHPSMARRWQKQDPRGSNRWGHRGRLPPEIRVLRRAEEALGRDGPAGPSCQGQASACRSVAPSPRVRRAKPGGLTSRAFRVVSREFPPVAISASLPSPAAPLGLRSGGFFCPAGGGRASPSD